MKKNSRTWKILEALKQSESSQGDNNKVDELVGRGSYFETISCASFGAINDNYTGSSAERHPTELTNYFVEYDLESICHCPSTSSKLIFYKRRIALFNFTILGFEAEKRNVYCYCWKEGIGRKGAIEIGSCLLNYLKTKADGRPITFMSDTCASQCRNMYISALLLYCIEAFDIPEINQKYFEPGHSQMEADNIHATIEQAKKDIPVFHPSGFYTIIRKASRKSPCNVYEMETKDFVDLKCLKTILIKNAKIDCDGNDVNWLKIKWLQYRKEDTKHIYFKYDMDDTDFKRIQVIRRGKRLPVEKNTLKDAYDQALPISAEKYEDLQDLCRQGIIPTQYHNFYEQFTIGTVNDDEDNCFFFSWYEKMLVFVYLLELHLILY